MNLPRTSQTIAQQRALAARRNVIHTAERERILREWRHPEAPAAPSVWQQIRAEFAEAPWRLKIGLVCWFGYGVVCAAWVIKAWLS